MQSICAVDFCDRQAVAKGWCGGHYRQQHGGKPFTPLREYKVAPNIRVCEFAGCGKVTRGKRTAYCRAHARQADEGRELAPIERRFTGKSLAERVASNTLREGSCLIWQGSTSKEGYAWLTFENVAQLGHRLVWEAAHGPIPSGMVIDHRCGNRACLELDHLQVVTYRENAENLRGAHADSKTGVRGVYEHQGRFVADVWAGGRRVLNRSFATLEEADAAARAARLAYQSNNLRDRM